MSARRIADIKKRSCREYEGHFFPYLHHSATGASFCFAIVFLFLGPSHTCACAYYHLHVHIDHRCVCGCFPLLFQIDSVYLAVCYKQSLCVLTAVFIAGSTWCPTPSPQACCWWRRCPETRWARSTRRTSCDTSSHEWTASTVYMTSHRFPTKVMLAVLTGRLYLFYPLPAMLIINCFVCHCALCLDGPIILAKLN